MTHASRWSGTLLVCGLLVGVAHGADQAVRSVQIQVKDPRPAVEPLKRRLVVEGGARSGANTIVGDPRIGGAVVTVFLDAQSETYVLAQGRDPRTGKPYWRGTAPRFMYEDGLGANSAVVSATIKRSANGTVRIKVVAGGAGRAITVRPPNPGSSACVTLELVGGDTYHLRFPAPPESTISRNDAKRFVIKRPLTEGLCQTPTTTSSTTTSTTTSTSSTTTSTSTTTVSSTTTSTTMLRCDGTGHDADCPALQQPEVMALVGREIWLDGERLVDSAVPAAEHVAVFACPDAQAAVARTDPEIAEWSATRIRLPLPQGVDSRCTVRVEAGAAVTRATPLRVYAATEVPLPVHPIVLDRGADGHVWIGVEFSSALFHLPPGASEVEILEIPTPRGFFRSRLQLSPQQPIPDVGVGFSGYVEHVVVGPDGTVWLSQGGWPFYRHDTGAPQPNGSRLVRYAPATGTWRCYNVPSQSAEIVGFSLLDDGTILVAAAGDDAILLVAPAALDAAGASECSSPQAAGVCDQGETAVDAGCWERHPLPGNDWHYPTHVHRDPATGDWWAVGAESNAALRYTPSTGVWTQWPLPETDRQPLWWWPWDGSQPWWFAIGSDGRVRTASFVAAALDELDPATGMWQRRQAPVASLTDWSCVYWHATDEAGRLWASGAFGAPGDLPARPLGYWLAGQDAGVFMPPLDDIPPYAQNGIAGFWISPDARTVYGARLFTKGVVRLEQVP